MSSRVPVRVASSLLASSLLASSLIVSSCIVTDAGVPPSAKLTCASTDDCPSGWTCEVDIALCLSPDAPRLVDSATVSTTIAGPNREVTVSFSFDRAVVDDTVSVRLVDARGAPVAGGEFARASGDGDHVFALLPTDVIEGEHTIEISAEGESGAVGRSFASTLVVDRTPPALLEVAGAPVAYVEPALVSGEAAVIAGFTATEPLADGDGAPPIEVAVVERASGARATVVASLVGPADARLEIAPDAARAEGTYDVVVTGFVDRAFNPADVDELLIGAFELDRTAPAVSFVSLTPDIVTPSGAASVLTVCLSVVDTHLGPAGYDPTSGAMPFVVTLADVDVTSTCTATDDACTHTCVIDVASDLLAAAVTPEEGPVLVVVTASDQAGNVTTDAAAVSWDERAPEVVNPFVFVEPGPENVLYAADALTDRSTLVIAFNTDEPVDGQPAAPASEDPTVTLSCEDGTTLEATRQPPFASTFFVYRRRLAPEDPVSDGACTVRVRARDVVGNERERALDELGPIRIDRTPPSVDTVDVDALLHLRAPWGTLLEEAAPGASLTLPFHALIDDQGSGVIDASIFDVPGEHIVMVRVWDAPSGEGAEIGRTERALDGAGEPIDPPAFEVRPLVTRDAASIWVSVVDDAGNDSPRRLVRRGQWMATTGAASTWALGDNPSVLFSTPVMSSALYPPAATIVRYPDPLLDPAEPANTVGATRAALVDVEGAASFERLPGPASPTPFPLEHAAVSSDPLRGNVLVFGGVRGNTLSGALYELDGGRAIARCASLSEPCLWKRPSPRVGAAMVYEPKLARTILVGGCATKLGNDVDDCDVAADPWLFDGTEFVEQPCEDAACKVSLARHRHAMAADGEGALYVFGGCLDVDCATPSADVIVVTSEGITNLCDDGVVGCTGTAPSPRGDAAVHFDGGTLFVFGGCETYAPDSGWTCTAPQGDLYTLDVATRVWTKHAVAPALDLSCARASLARLVPGSLFGATTPLVVGLCAQDGEPARLVRLTNAPPTLAPLSLAPFGDALDVDRRAVIVVDAKRERPVVVSSTSATTLVLDGPDDDTPFAARLVDDTPSGPTSALERAIVATTSGEVLYVTQNAANDGETWAWNGAAWRLVCASCGPESVITAATVASGPLAGPLVIGGGKAWRYVEGQTPDPWVLIEVGAPSAPLVSLVSDGADGALLIGREGGDLVAWRLVAGTFVPLDTSSAAMSPRFGVGAAFSSSRDAIVSFGGCAGLVCAPFDDTFAIAAASGALVTTPIATVVTPAARGAAIVVEDPWRARVVMFGGIDQNALVQDGAYELAPEGWRARVVVDVESDGDPTGVVAGTGAGDARQGGIVFTDGASDAGAASLWRYDAHPFERPAHVFVTSFLAAGVPASTSIEFAFTRFVGGGASPSYDGTILVGWRGDRWQALGVGEGSPTTLAPASALVGDDGDPATDDDDVERYFFDEARLLAFALVPGPNMSGTARLTSAFVELAVRYTLPDE